MKNYLLLFAALFSFITLLADGDCEGFDLTIESSLLEGGPAFLTWEILDDEEMLVAEGVAQFSIENPDYSVNLCLEWGCYTLNLGSDGIWDPLAISLDFVSNDVEFYVYELYIGMDGIGLGFGIGTDCESTCPEDYGSVMYKQCGCFGFEIGSFVEGENVIWDWGDGSVSEGGHFAEHCYYQNGVYEVSAFYVSPDCEGETYTIEVVVECFNICNLEVDFEQNECGQGVYEAFDYEDGVTLVWYVDTDNEAYATGVDMINVNLEPGEHFVCVSYESENCPESVNWCFEFVVDDCDGCPSDAGFWAQEECGCFVYEIGSFVEGESVDWYFGDEGEIIDGGHIEDFCFGENGTYIVTANYSSPLCEGQTYTFEVEVDCFINECDLDVEVVDLGCGSFVFEASNFPEGANIHWYVDTDNTLYADDTHIIDVLFEEEGVHWVCAFYVTADCPEGVEWCTEFEVELCEEGCPTGIWMSEAFDCGCYEFEIGSFVEGESVIWYWGDGSETMGGHYAEHCYEEEGEYIITAWYTSPQCEGMLYTLGIANVDCEEECVPLVFGLDSDVAEGGPTYLMWNIFNENGILVDGICQYSEEMPYCDFSACLYEGCYTLSIWSATDFNQDEYFGLFLPEGIDVVADSYDYTEGVYLLEVQFSVLGGCEEEDDCPNPEEVWVGNMEDCGCYGFEIGSFVEGEEVDWYFGDGTTIENGGHFVEHCFPNGVWTVTAWYESPNCEGAEYLVAVVEVNCSEDCFLEVSYDQIDNDSFLFMAEVPEGAIVTWDFGDGTSETANVADHTYEVGWYTVCASYETEDCPLTISCFDIDVVDIDGDCPEEIWQSAGFECGCFEFEIGSFEEGEEVMWDFGDGNMYDGGHYVDYCYEVDGEYVVTAWYTSPLCEGMFYTFEVVHADCDPCDLEVEVIDEGCGTFILEAYDFPENAVLFWAIDDVIIAENTHIIDLVFEEEGQYEVEIYYETPDCPNGVFVTVVLYAEPCNDCPQELYVGDANDCGCFEFEIGPFVEGESVDWDFGDGEIALDEGHYITHCYEVDGLYIGTVIYTSPLCPDGIILSFTVEVDCGDCTVVNFGMDSQNNSITELEWVIYSDDVAFEDGICEYTPNQPYCDFDMCLEPGCYTIEFDTDEAVNDDSFFYGAFIDGYELDLFDVSISDNQHHVSFSFGVDSDCDTQIEEVQGVDWSVYPVPASEFIMIEIDDILLGSEIVVLDINGRQVLRDNLYQLVHTISLSSLAEGIYNLVLVSQLQMECKRISIVR